MIDFGGFISDYEEKAIHQLLAAKDLFLFAEQSGFIDDKDIVELGCGTGFLTKILDDKIDPGIRINPTDISEKMISHCKKSGFSDRVCFDILDFEDTEKMKTIINHRSAWSAMSLHWSRDIVCRIHDIMEVSDSLAFSVPAVGSLSDLINLFSAYDADISDNPMIKVFVDHEYLINSIDKKFDLKYKITDYSTPFGDLKTSFKSRFRPKVNTTKKFVFKNYRKILTDNPKIEINTKVIHCLIRR